MRGLIRTVRYLVNEPRVKRSYLDLKTLPDDMMKKTGQYYPKINPKHMVQHASPEGTTALSCPSGAGTVVRRVWACCYQVPHVYKLCIWSVGLQLAHLCKRYICSVVAFPFRVCVG